MSILMTWEGRGVDGTSGDVRGRRYWMYHELLFVYDDHCEKGEEGLVVYICRASLLMRRFIWGNRATQSLYGLLQVAAQSGSTVEL